MGVVWVLRDSLLNALCASPHRRQELVGWCAERTLDMPTLDMFFAPTLIVAQVYSLDNSHWVLPLLWIAPTREYLCLKFDPLSDQPRIVGAIREELDAFGALAFTIAPLHSTLIGQIDGVNCHPACLLTVRCTLSRHVVKGILQVPHDKLWLLREIVEATTYFSRCKLASTPRTLGLHWEVAQMYTEPKSVDPVDKRFSCDGTPHIACPSSLYFASVYLVSIGDFCWIAPILGGQPSYYCCCFFCCCCFCCYHLSRCVDLSQGVCGASSVPRLC